MVARVRDHGGTVVDFVGDNMLAEFKSGLAAVKASLAMQEDISSLNAEHPDDRRMRFRIGIHLGDVTSDGERIYGDGVNIAARLQSLAQPGGICISDAVLAQVRTKLDLPYRDLGEQHLKNIAEPVRAYQLSLANGHRSDTAPARVTFPVSAKPSLAVLPFVNLSSDPDQEYMSDGLTLSIVTALIKIPGLLLISDTATAPYKHGSIPLQELGKVFGVSHILDGGIQRSGSRVRVTVRLTETAGGRQIWAEQFDKKLDDLFAVQDEITAEVVEAMDVKLISGEPARTVRHALKTPAAIEAYYRGWSALFQSSPDQTVEARYWFEETIRLDPTSPLGYALAAWTYCLLAVQTAASDREKALDEASVLAKKALGLGDVTGLPHLALAQVNLMRHNHQKALQAVEAAILERPSCDMSYAVKASILNYLGRPLEAMPLARQAMRISPVHPSFYPLVLATAAYFGGRFEEAAGAAGRALEIDQENVQALIILAAAQIRLDLSEQARGAVRRILQLQPELRLDTYASSQPYKDTAALERLLADLRAAGLG
jgi:adenylate cyclase